TVWPASGLSNAPAVGGSYATWMRTYGTGIRFFHVDGDHMDTAISGYNIGIDFEMSTNGPATAPFYEGYVTNCAIAVNAQVANLSPAVEFSDFTVVNFQFSHCTITGDNGTAVNFVGNTWQSGMAFQSCAITGTMNLTGPGVLNAVDCSFNANTQCVISASATRAALVGCTFIPSQNIVNNGSANNLLVDARQSISNSMPIVYWTNIMNNYASRQPAKQALLNVLDYGAVTNSSGDSTAAIQAALNAAGANGGGIVYLPAGQYSTTNTLFVPSGVELRGANEMRHSTVESLDRQEKGSILLPTGGQGTTNGPVAIALEANSGLVGVTIFYPTQTSNSIPFPATIQGQGANVYAIALQCPNPYYYVDFNTYTCTNHLLYMVDGWALETGCNIGNGSSGTIANCHGNFSYWHTYWPDQGKALSSAGEAPVESFGKHNLQYYVLGNCTELFAANFSIGQNIFMYGNSQNSVGPSVTAIDTMCDSTYEPYVFNGAGPSTVNIVNPNWLVVVSGYSDLTNATALTTTSNYQGIVRVFNSPLCGGTPIQDYVIGGGDVGFELVHMFQYANSGIEVNGGVFHLINCGAIDVVHGSTGAFNLKLGANAGLSGKTNEFIGDYAFNGYTFTNLNSGNPANVWADYAINSNMILSNETESITSIPPLAVQSLSKTGEVVLQWPDNGTTYKVYYTASLNPPVIWTPLTNQPVHSEGVWTITPPFGTSQSGFYRLQE
ncbi:MAG: glycosyl hydrolase family 28-related protein, partial [Verrucomicrobiota bacterium]